MAKPIKSNLTQEQLKELVHYDPETGVITWLGNEKVRNRDRNKICNSLRCDGYLQIGINGGKFKQHRIAWLYHYGEWPDNFLDHIDGIKTNNAITNLRVVDNAVNMQNQKTAHRNNKSGLLGVVTNRNAKSTSYTAEIKIDKKKYRFGTYPTPEQAHSAYLKAKRELHAACTI